MLSGKGRTNNGVLYEKHTDRHTDKPVIIFTGIGVMPSDEEPYMGTVAQQVAEEVGECIVAYQPGVSATWKNPWTRGLYTATTEKKQLDAALELADGRRFTPVTHSYSSLLGAKLQDPNYRNALNAETAMPGVVSAIVTSVADGMKKEDGSTRTILGIPGYFVFLVGQHLPLLSPLYPLKMLEDHAHFDEAVPHKAIADTWINSLTAESCFKLPYDNVQPDRQSIGLITEGDNIFSAELQEEAYIKIGCKPVRINTGHRWMVGRDSQKAIDEIVAQHKRNELFY